MKSNDCVTSTNGSSGHGFSHAERVSPTRASAPKVCPAAAEAVRKRNLVAALTARLKSCPDGRQRGFAIAFPVRTVLLLALVALPLRAEIVDRILAVVGTRVITWSDVLAETNYQAFLGGQEPVTPDKSLPRDPILSRLIDQRLLEQERDALPLSFPDEGEAGRRLEEIRQRFPEPEAYQRALARYRLTEADLVARLEREANLMAFVERRLRPQVRLNPAEVEHYYSETLTPELRRQGQSAVPPLAEVRERIEQVLTEQEINRRLDEWLRDLRERRGIKILP